MRFRSKEMTKWPKTDANLILIFEILLMTAFLIMNTADSLLQIKDQENYFAAGLFPISSNLVFLFDSFSVESLFIIERFTWWFHILGILLFMNYVLISKHLHIFFAFPSTYFANINNLGKIDNLVSVTNEVKLMLDPNTDPYSSQSLDDSTIEKLPQLFGARDATDLNWVQLLNSYSCTECGRCSSVCPANQTGKLLSPRKIMMDTRDRIEEIGKNNDNNDQKFLLGDYITNEEIWACTTCNACTDACPIDLDPLSIIVDLRRYLVMEESSAPTELNNMFSNIENNGAPWQFPASDRLKWLDNN
jgi:heterodisulfide reductase subunit C